MANLANSNIHNGSNHSNLKPGKTARSFRFLECYQPDLGRNLIPEGRHCDRKAMLMGALQDFIDHNQHFKSRPEAKWQPNLRNRSVA